MLAYIIRRILYMIPTVILISIICFIIIQLPPGDYMTTYTARLRSVGGEVSQEAIENLRIHYGLDQPLYKQYFLWISGFPRGDFGIAMSIVDTPVLQIIGRGFLLTFILLLITLIFTLVVAISIGVYSATHKYTIIDHLLSFLAFIGMAIPPFLLALGLMFISVFYFNAQSIGGLFSPGYESFPWWGKIFDFIKHLPMPVIAIGIANIAIMMRIMRGNLMDILACQYIQTARAKGLKEVTVIYKHAVRIAINPIISRVGMSLPEIVAASMVVEILLDLPTIGPIFYRSLIMQDMYLAGAILFIISVVLLLGNLVADILLVWTDPRICYD